MAPRLTPADAAKRIRGRGLPRPVKISLSVAGLALGVLAIAILSASIWQARTLPSRISRSLPPPPELGPGFGALQMRLEDAGAQAADGPDRLEGVARLGGLYHANGHLQEAAACWSLLAAEQPDEGRWVYRLADIAATIGNTDETRRLLLATVRVAPDYAPAWLKLGDLEFKTGNPDPAGRAYARRLALEPDDPYARLGQARLAMQADDRAAAREILDQILGLHPDFSAAHNLLAEILAVDGDSLQVRQHRWSGREAGRFRKAEDPWLDELEAWCFDPSRLRTLGTMANQTGDGANAVRWLTRAIELSPDDPYGYALLGDVHLVQGNPAAARDILEMGLAIGGEIEPVDLHYVALAQAYRELGQPEEAIQIIREGIRRIGGSCELHDALGIALGETGAFEEAAAAFAAALADKPHDSNAHYNRANALLNLGREDEAVHHLKESLVLQPTFPKSLFMLARYEMEAGRLKEAGDYLRPLHLSHPEQDRVRQLMVTWLYRLGKRADASGDRTTAEAHYREGLSVDPDAPPLNLDLGVLLLIGDQVPESLPFLERYRRLQPGDPQGALFLGQAQARTGRFAEARATLEEGASLADASGNARTASFCREILSQLPER